MPKYTTETRTKVFWSKVNKNGSVPVHCPELGNCWEWVGYCDQWGYGRFCHQPAHRFSWELHNHKITDGLLACHKCDNPCCVNPNHLFLGTNQDNVNDREQKNRHNRGVGEFSSHHKLSKEQIAVIRGLYRNGVKQKEIGLRFQISQAHISKIVRNETWKDE